MSEGASHSSTEETLLLLDKVEVRLEKARNETSGLRWYKQLNPARKLRFNNYERQLNEAHRLWREGDSSSALASLRALDRRYPSVLGLIYGMPRKRENRREVHEIKEEKALKRLNFRQVVSLAVASSLLLSSPAAVSRR